MISRAAWSKSSSRVEAAGVAHVLFACVATVAAESRAETVPVAQVTWTEKAPQADGKLDEGIWRTAKAHQRFVERQPELRARPPVITRFRVLVDARALYLGVECLQPPETPPYSAIAASRYGIRALIASFSA
jgi:hypothetical protein